MTYWRAGRRLLPRSVGPGGLVPVMTPVMRRFGGRWMFSSFSPEDREVARSSPGGRERDGFVLQVLDVPEAMHRGHYEVVSVEYLGRLFHYLFELARAPVFDRRFAAAWRDYARVNALYAEAILRAPGEDPVFVEDHHLMLVGRDSSDSVVETLRGQRVAATVLGIGFAGLIGAGIARATQNLPVTGFPGGDSGVVANELEKLTLYAPEGAITAEQVRALVPISRAAVIFELGNALARRDAALALNLVRDLLDQGETAIGILLATILPTIRHLLLAKDLMERHHLPRPQAPFAFISTLNRLPPKETKHLPRKKDGAINGYALGIAAMNAHRFETNQLVRGMEACLQANLELVTTQLDKELVLTEIVVKLLG